MNDAVEIVFHGQAATAAKKSRDKVLLDHARTLGALLIYVSEQHGTALRQLLFNDQCQMQRSLLLMVNGVRVLDLARELRSGDEVLVLPPIGG